MKPYSFSTWVGQKPNAGNDFEHDDFNRRICTIVYRSRWPDCAFSAITRVTLHTLSAINVENALEIICGMIIEPLRSHCLQRRL